MDLQQRFFNAVIENRAYSKKSLLKRHLRYMFSGVALSGKNILDVGGGKGLLALWAAVNGADAILLEPEGDGSSKNMLADFEILKSSISKDLNAFGYSDVVENYLQSSDRKYDAIMMANCINHIDEEVCSKLNKNEAEWKTYLDLFCLIGHHLHPGGKIVITDCDRRNFFGDLGLRSPLASSIEWDIHQSPFLWSKLLVKSGFEIESIQWTTPNSFGAIGRLLFGNRIAAYFLLSHFRLVATKSNDK